MKSPKSKWLPDLHGMMASAQKEPEKRKAAQKALDNIQYQCAECGEIVKRRTMLAHLNAASRIQNELELNRDYRHVHRKFREVANPLIPGSPASESDDRRAQSFTRSAGARRGLHL